MDANRLKWRSIAKRNEWMKRNEMKWNEWNGDEMTEKEEIGEASQADTAGTTRQSRETEKGKRKREKKESDRWQLAEDRVVREWDTNIGGWTDSVMATPSNKSVERRESTSNLSSRSRMWTKRNLAEEGLERRWMRLSSREARFGRSQVADWHKERRMMRAKEEKTQTRRIRTLSRCYLNRWTRARKWAFEQATSKSK